MKLLIVSLMLTVSILSCKKKEVHEENSVTETLKVSDFSMLETGNYWIYQRYQIDLIKNEKKMLSSTDSLYVANDTLINGKTYHQLKGTWFGINFHRNLRLENNRLIDQSDNIYFLPQEDAIRILRKDSNPLNRFWDSIIWSMEHVNFLVETPLLNFNSEYQYNVRYFFNPKIIFDSSYAIRNDTEYYVKGIGVVRYTSSYTSPIDLHMDLIRYHVK